MLINGSTDFIDLRGKLCAERRFAVNLQYRLPFAQGVNTGDAQPARDPFAFVAHHIHRVTPVALADKAQSMLIGLRQKVVECIVDTLLNCLL